MPREKITVGNLLVMCEPLKVEYYFDLLSFGWSGNKLCVATKNFSCFWTVCFLFCRCFVNYNDRTAIITFIQHEKLLHPKVLYLTFY